MILSIAFEFDINLFDNRIFRIQAKLPAVLPESIPIISPSDINSAAFKESSYFCFPNSLLRSLNFLKGFIAVFATAPPSTFVNLPSCSIANKSLRIVSIETQKNQQDLL